MLHKYRTHFHDCGIKSVLTSSFSTVGYVMEKRLYGDAVKVHSAQLPLGGLLS